VTHFPRHFLNYTPPLYPVWFGVLATPPDNQTTTGAKARKERRRLSKDGKWRSFPKVPGLVPYVRSGAYSGKITIQGKQIRQSKALNPPSEIANTAESTALLHIPTLTAHVF
jgi:hypothetical protein